MQKTLKIATRMSPLALWQAQYVKLRIKKNNPELNINIVKILTKGDKTINIELSKIGGKSLFIKELELSLLRGEADIAVHSMKDIPYKMPKEFVIGAILKRENPFDALVANNFNSIYDLPYGAKIGTCSTRRIVQLKALRNDLKIISLRGNINTRIKKLDANKYDAIILACAGLIRLGLKSRIKQQITKEQILPAVGQGAIGIEICKDDTETLKLIKPLADFQTTQRITTERAMNAKLKGGCTMPIAGFSTADKDKLTLTGLVGNVKTGNILKHSICGSITNPTELGVKLADKLLSLGAQKILNGY